MSRTVLYSFSLGGALLPDQRPVRVGPKMESGVSQFHGTRRVCPRILALPASSCLPAKQGGLSHPPLTAYARSHSSARRGTGEERRVSFCPDREDP